MVLVNKSSLSKYENVGVLNGPYTLNVIWGKAFRERAVKFLYFTYKCSNFEQMPDSFFRV